MQVGQFGDKCCNARSEDQFGQSGVERFPENSYGIDYEIGAPQSRLDRDFPNADSAEQHFVFD